MLRFIEFEEQFDELVDESSIKVLRIRQKFEELVEERSTKSRQRFKKTRKLLNDLDCCFVTSGDRTSKDARGNRR